MKKYIKWILFFGLLLLFCFIAFNVYNDNNFYSDRIIYDFVSGNIINDNMTKVFKIITWFGGAVGICIMCFVSFFLIKNKKINIILFSTLICATIINNFVFKLIFARERPSINPIVIESGYSFPSGHSMISMVFYGSLIYLAYKYINNKKIRYVVISCLSLLIILIGFSRIYLGVHYFSDVIGGYILGICYLVVSSIIIKKIIKKI